MQPTPPYNLAPATTLSRIESLADTILNEVGIAIEHHPPSLKALRNKERDILTKRMTSEQLTEAKAMAEKCRAQNYKNCDKLAE